ncbi:MAG: hypothetical protein ORN28_03555 [Rhodoferax sp.]|nr:hypothetical protein [Rhodoferax sp.]
MQPLHHLRFAVNDRIQGEVAKGLLAASTLWADLELLQSSNAPGKIAARQNPQRSYHIADTANHTHLRIDASTNFRKTEEAWVQVEKFISGRVVDWGGKTKPNVHLETEDGTMLVVAATQKMLEAEQQNHLYRNTLLHISAEENLLNGALRNAQLLAFDSHQPRFDESEFQEMVRRGTAAWASVPNATDWVEQLRGGTP